MTPRRARPADASEMADLLNRFIRDTTISFKTRETPVSAMEALIIERLSRDLPCLVAEQDGRFLGFASAAPFRAGEGYAHTLEHALYVVPQAHGTGTGRALLTALEAAARQQDAQSLVAGISAENEVALRFHGRQGFSEVGRVAQAGFKFNRWIDLVLLQKHLSSPSDSD
ncbi:MAG: N-acetyltransferase family protein [Pseudomonadota bacterium]